MIIAVDYQSVRGRRTGIGTAAFHLVEAMRRKEPSWTWKLYDTGSDRELRTPQRIAWESLTVPFRAVRDRADIVYSPGFAPSLWGRAPRVVTVHDLMGLVEGAHLPVGARFYWSRWLPFCMRQAQVLVASSESTRRDIARYLGRDEAGVEVVPLAAGPAFKHISPEEIAGSVAEAGLTDKPYWIAVATLEPRKNAQGLLRAFRMFLDRYPGAARLALVGKPGGHESVIQTLIRELRLGEDVRLLGYVSDARLNALYRGAFAFSFVSFYEGFGLPVLEAMTCGRTGVVSQAASLPEVGGDAVEYVDPANPSSIAEAMERLWANADHRKNLEERALRRAGTFSWDRAAAKMIEVFRRIA